MTCFRCFRVVSLSLAVFISAMLLGGCVDGIALPPADAYHITAAEGWLQFELGHYDNAIGFFDEASEMEPMLSQAYLGLGWCYAMLDQMEASLSNIELTIVRDPESPDGHAARAFVYLARDEYETAAEAASEAVSLGGEEYVFSQIPEVRTENLRLLMAESYYAVGQYADAQAQVDILKPDNNLNQDSRTYKRDLLLEIEGLGSAEQVLEKSGN